MAPPTTVAADVDDNGNPLGPAGAGKAKKKEKNLTYAALAIGAIGVALVIFKKGGSSSAATTATPATGTADYAASLSDALNTQQQANQAGMASILAAIAGIAPNSPLNPSAPVAGAQPPPTPWSSPGSGFSYGGGQLQSITATAKGGLLHQWTGAAGNWMSEILPGNVAPGQDINVTQDAFGVPGRLDFTAKSTSAGSSVHDWYTPAGGWHTETVTAQGYAAPPSSAVTGAPSGVTASGPSAITGRG